MRAGDRAGCVRRELSREDGNVDAPHRHRVPFGPGDVGSGLDYASSIAEALEAQRANGRGRLATAGGECGLETEQITRGLSMQWGWSVLP